MKLALAAVLVLGITFLGVRGWMLGTLSIEYLWLIFIGDVCGVIYLINGGWLPKSLSKYFEINAEDNPSNLPVRIYLPILLIAIVAAVIAIVLWKP